MKTRTKTAISRITALLLSLALVLGMTPMTAFATENGSTSPLGESTTLGTSAQAFGFTPFASGTVNIDGKTVAEAETALTTALTGASSGDTITVTGTITGAATTITLPIPAGVTVKWQAKLSGATAAGGMGVGHCLIFLTGDGTFEVAAGGEINTTAGNCIDATGTSAKIKVSGGKITTSGYSAIFADGASVSIDISGGELTSTSTAMNATLIFTDGLDSTVTVSGGKLSTVANNTAIVCQGAASKVTVSGGEIRTKSGVTIDCSGTEVAVSGGIVSSANATAISCQKRITITGGMVSSTLANNWPALYVSDATAVVAISGGTVFGHSDLLTGNSGSDLIHYNNNPAYFSGATGTGVVIGWDIGAGTTSYIAGTAIHLIQSPAGATGATVEWAVSGSDSGIYYADSTNTNTGFIPVAGVTVVQPAASVSINKPTLPLTVGGTDTLVATVLPANSTNKAVTWVSSNPAVATVDTNGVVTAVSAGSATITVTTADGGFTATCAVTVTTVPVASVSVNKLTLPLTVGGTDTLVATVLPANATNKAVTWVSSNPAVATVDTSGVVTAVSAGSATITVTTADGGFTATCAVTVTTVPVASVSVNKLTLPLTVGGTDTLVATVLPANATNKAVTWVSSNPAVATVDTSGVVTAVSAGSATITVTTADGGFTATCAVTVTTVPVASVSVNKLTLPLTVGGTDTLVATVLPANSTNKAVTWTSSNSAVATVDTNGVVTAVSAGSATITTTTADGGFTATCAVTVSAIPPTVVPVSGLSINKASLTLVAGGTTETLAETILPANATNKAVIWTSDNTAVATVANGVVTPVAAGSATITVTTADGGFTATCAVTVLPTGTVIVPVSKVSVLPKTASVAVGKTQQITTTIEPTNATVKDISWGSSNTAVAAVDGNGLVTAIGAGNATITATNDNSGLSDSCAVTVTAGGAPTPVYPSGGGSSSSGGGTNKADTRPVVGGTTTGTTTSKPLTKAEATKQFEAALAAKPAGATALSIKINNATSVSKAILAELASLAKKHGVTLTVHFDTVVGGKVVSRLSVNPATATGDLDLTIKENKALAARFAKFFGNPLAAYTVPAAGSVAIKLPENLKPEDLVLYSYDVVTNTYALLTGAKPWVDSNGYLHFELAAGSEVVISQGKLVKSKVLARVN